MSEEQKFVWITKYALTAGIEKLPLEEISGKMAVCTAPGYCNDVRYMHGQDWHHEEESAKEQANRMVKRKIASLEKQIQKLKVLKF